MDIKIRRRMIGTIPVLELAPSMRLTQALACVVYYHGWQSHKELALTQGRKLAKAGYRVVLPDALNHGERKQEVTKIPSQTFWSSIQANLMEFGFIIDYFKQRKLITDDIGVAGISMGGFTTCGLLTHHPEIKVAACMMGMPDYLAYRDLIKGHAKEFGAYLPDDLNDILGWLPYYDLASQPRLVGDRPVLFWHGNQDQRVPIEPVRDFIKNNPDLDLYYMEDDIGHLVTTETMDNMTQFFKDKL